MKRDNQSLNKEFYFNLYNVQRNISRYFTNINLKEFDITYPQFLVLNILWQENTTNVKTIVNSLGLDTGTISPLLKRMENKGLIKRQRSDLDQREVFLYLTEKSIEIANSLDNVINENKAIASLSDSEIKEMNKLLLKILEDK
ncbi:TPA: MarR family transcriptional regulator [Staphylococcus aureus]|uniref:MarR family winged helix-turn-helix transcriptional regulator n=1 Tax=Staphylococcus TaxID=1279 RepID=UPI000453698C|nr:MULTISPECIES: MarR family transcriptional regulator [Staphylococcus]HDA8516587.1 MarR family transcriptional regulator [Staphylococcus aureus]EWI86052.1 hypothetical protein U667_02741 [Staphylococcus aureus T44811]EYK00130.1 hypothetical protein V606_02415 [Staphylococcus aureus M17027]MDW3868552.1 MarR family transcriptional regulator [Staphylococcus saprophyticus]MDW3920776.1 MarR family transcriptional regulator [Staphylococcus saprophyticus]